MPFEIAPSVYVPDMDPYTIPGAISDMSGFVPLERGAFATVQKVLVGSLDATEPTIRHAEVFDNVNFLFSFTRSNISKYAFSAQVGAKTEIHSATAMGFAEVRDWSAAQWGTRIIACGRRYEPGVADPLPVLSSVNGATFTALSGTPPSAAYVAANVNFVMLAHTDDGTEYRDEVWWSGLQNPLTWTPSIATQAGRYRLLDVPGRITALVGYKDVFLAFKEKGVFIGEYVGPPFIFNWRLLSRAIGCVNNHSVVEVDDKLYFINDNGMYEFDGTNFRCVSTPIWRSILHQSGYTKERVGTAPGNWPSVPYGENGLTSSYFEDDMESNIALGVDQFEGVVWVLTTVLGTVDYWYAWCYNVRTGKWSRVGRVVSDGKVETGFYLNNQYPLAVKVSWKRMKSGGFYSSGSNVSQWRIWLPVNIGTPSNACKVFAMAYPAASDTDTLTGHIDTGIVGRPEGSSDAVGVHINAANGSDASAFSACTLYGYANESMTTGQQTATATLNSDLDRFDGRISSRFRMARLTLGDNKTCILSGVGIESKPIGKR